MVPPERRARRSRPSDQIIDLRQAAANRSKRAEAPAPTSEAPPPLPEGDLAAPDRPLLDTVRRCVGESALPALHEIGRHVGSTAARRDADTVEAVADSLPALRSHDARGERIDELDVHPAWHALLDAAVGAGLGGLAWAGQSPGSHLTRAAGLHLWTQGCASSALVLSTTYAATAGVVGSSAAKPWLARLATDRYEQHDRRPATKRGCLGGLALTERGSRAEPATPTTHAEPVPGGPVEGGQSYRLTGHKWFVTNPGADVLLATAQCTEGPTAFLLPRTTDDGTRNRVRLVRLKRGLSARAACVAELELDGAWGVRLGSAGASEDVLAKVRLARRLDACAMASGVLRAALVLAGHHATSRVVGGRRLVEAPLARTVLADLAIESEAATLVSLRLAGALDASLGRPGSQEPAAASSSEPSEYSAALLRLALPVTAYWLSRRAPLVTSEAVEALGSYGWSEESPAPRLYRAAGSLLSDEPGNTLALSVIRVLSTDGEAVEAFVGECEAAKGEHPRLDAALRASRELLATARSEARNEPATVESAARWLVERLAVCLQASLAVRHSPGAVAAAFVASRLDSAGGRGLGSLPLGPGETATVVDRALADG